MSILTRSSRWVRLLLGALVVGAVSLTAVGPAGATVPSVTDSPTSGAYGAEIQLGGGGWPAYDGLVVDIGTTYMCSVSADSTGAIPAQDCPVPAGIVAGSYTLKATDGTNTANAASPFVVHPAVQVIGSGGNPTGIVAAGEAVTLTGYDFAGTSGVTATFNGSPVTLSPATSTNSAGSFTGAGFTVPAVAAGTYPVVVTDGSSNTATASVEVAVATLVTPASDPSGTSFSVSGAGWPGSDSMTVRFYLGSVDEAYGCSVVSDTTGAIAPQTCTVPTSLPAGAYSLVMSDGYVSVVKSVTVTPSVTVSAPIPNAYATDAVAVGQTVSLSGTGFTGGSAITATFNGSPVTLSPSPTTNGTGTFTGSTFVVPTVATKGSYPLVVTDASSITTTLTLTVYVAKVTVAGSGLAGASLTVSGSGWPGGDGLVVRLFQGGTDEAYLCSVTANSAGGIPQQGCSLPTNLPGGSYSVVATDTYVTVSKAFTLKSNVLMYAGTNPTGVAAVGQTIGLTGYAFTPGASVSAKFNGVAVTLTPSPVVTSAGGFTATSFVVPVVAAGKYPLVLKDSVGRSATVTLRVYAATLNAPGSGVAGGLYTITGAGWPRTDAGLTLRLYQGTVDESYLCSPVSDSTGTIPATTCTLPTSLAAGSYSAVLSDGYVTVTSPFAMHPSIRLTTTSSVPAGSAAPGTTLDLAGYGFAAGSIISSVKVGSTGVTLTPTSPATNGSGAFSGVSFVVPSIAAGTYVVTVKDAGSNTATVQLVVT